MQIAPQHVPYLAAVSSALGITLGGIILRAFGRPDNPIVIMVWTDERLFYLSVLTALTAWAASRLTLAALR
jgi:hypothetical protein